nr:family 43 glycosylhydrolase [Allomuricauda sp.]
MEKMVLIFMLCICCSVQSQDGSNGFEWENPIRKGINGYGMKDFFVFEERDSLYLVGTEYPDPFKGYLGPNLYAAKEFNIWEKVSNLVETDRIPKDAWYKDAWTALELFKHSGTYYLSFNNRNNSENPYQKLGFGLAKSESLHGPYEVINKKTPAVKANHGSIVFAPDETPYLTYDMDGRIYLAEINLDTGLLQSGSVELLGPETLKEKYRYLDAANITKVGETYHMLFSQFFGGYIVRIYHMTANHPKGPWQWSGNNPLYTFLEAEADLKVKMVYPERHGFAPPTQVIFSHDLFKGQSGNYFMVYHSSEKYSEPYLVIEPIKLEDDGTLTLLACKESFQKILVHEE